MLAKIAGILASLYGIIKGVEAIMGTVKEISKFAIKGRKDQVIKEIAQGFKTLNKTGDTRDLEKAIGNINAGQPTQHEHPDIQTRPARDRSEQ